MAQKHALKGSSVLKKTARSGRPSALAEAPRGWTPVARSTKADARVSISADAVSKSLADLEARQFGAAESPADAARSAATGKSAAKTMIRRSQGQEKSVTLVNRKISSFQG